MSSQSCPSFLFPCPSISLYGAILYDLRASFSLSHTHTYIHSLFFFLFLYRHFSFFPSSSVMLEAHVKSDCLVQARKEEEKKKDFTNIKQACTIVVGVSSLNIGGEMPKGRGIGEYRDTIKGALGFPWSTYRWSASKLFPNLCCYLDLKEREENKYRLR